MAGKWREVVLLQKIVHTHPQQLRDYTDVIAMVEPLQQVYTFAEVIVSQTRSKLPSQGNVLAIQGVPLLEFLKNPNFNLACVPVLWDRTDNLDGNPLICLSVDGLHDLAECSLAQEPHGPV